MVAQKRRWILKMRVKYKPGSDKFYYVYGTRVDSEGNTQFLIDFQFPYSECSFGWVSIELCEPYYGDEI